MRILISNDDGYDAQGIRTLVKILKPYGEITVVAPKHHQSGTSMCLSMGLKPLAAKKISESESERWYYLDATPVSCVKFGIDNVFTDGKPDLVVSGINHGANSATASLYSATVGAAMEGALAGIPAIAVSMDDMSRHSDFSTVEKYFPSVFEKILESMKNYKFGTVYNVNFPKPGVSVKGVRLGHMGRAHWEKEYRPYDFEWIKSLGILPEKELMKVVGEPEEGESFYMMAGDFTDEPTNSPDADHRLMSEGYVAVCIHNYDNTDYAELERVRSLGMESDF